MIDVVVHFADDLDDQVVTFAVMPHLDELVLLTFEGSLIPTPWRVTKVLHLIHAHDAPGVSIHVDPA